MRARSTAVAGRRRQRSRSRSALHTSDPEDSLPSGPARNEPDRLRAPDAGGADKPQVRAASGIPGTRAVGAELGDVTRVCWVAGSVTRGRSDLRHQTGLGIAAANERRAPRCVQPLTGGPAAHDACLVSKRITPTEGQVQVTDVPPGGARPAHAWPRPGTHSRTPVSECKPTSRNSSTSSSPTAPPQRRRAPTATPTCVPTKTT
jgi:hypothetical protein